MPMACTGPATWPSWRTPWNCSRPPASMPAAIQPPPVVTWRVADLTAHSLPIPARGRFPAIHLRLTVVRGVAAPVTHSLLAPARVRFLAIPPPLTVV
jgi:hypothetical protein